MPWDQTLYRTEMNKEYKKLGQYIFENHNFDGTVDEFLEQTAPLIGYLVHNFNSLDEQLNRAICERINDKTDEPGAIIIHKMNFSAKVDLFNNLVRSMEIAFESTIPNFKILIDRLKKCATLRNAVVHAEWENMNENGYAYVKMTFNDKGMQQHYWQFTPESLESIVEFIQETNSMFDLYEEGKQDLFNKP
ncbi:MAG: hypothetical protein U5K54_28170 [Cytophagales bacterium]|nr:hypothetical protein [Cytophagales bacterium]